MICFSLPIFKTGNLQKLYKKSLILLKDISIFFAFLAPMFPIITVVALSIHLELHFSAFSLHSNFHIALCPLYWFIRILSLCSNIFISCSTHWWCLCKPCDLNLHYWDQHQHQQLKHQHRHSFRGAQKDKEIRSRKLTQASASQAVRTSFTLWNFFSWCFGLFLLSAP
jgi:hypothetical protein